MTEIGYYRYEGFDLRTKFGWVSGAIGIQATEPARIGMGNLGNVFADSDLGVRDLLAPLGVEWQGVAAEATADSLRKAAERAGFTGVASSGAGTAVDGYGQSFESLRPKVAWQDPGNWDWWEMPIDVTGVSLDAAFGDVFDVQSDYTATIQQNRTLDAQANEALYGHESQARAALSGFPVVEPAAAAPPAVAPSGFDGLGSGSLGGAPSGAPLMPTGAPTVVSADRAPGGPFMAPFGAAGDPARIGPVQGPSPGGPDRSAPGTTTGSPSTVPVPGGPAQGAPGVHTPPGRAAPHDGPAAPVPRTPWGSDRQPGSSDRGLPPAATIVGTGPGADRRAPSGLDRTGPNVGPSRPGGPRPTPSPGVGPGPGTTPYRTPGDLGRTGSPGTGPGGRLVSGGEFAGRLPGATPEQAAPARPPAPPGGAPSTPRAVAGHGMPFVGGMGAGGAATPTEHRPKYWIPSTEAFDVELPPHTEPVIEGREE